MPKWTIKTRYVPLIRWSRGSCGTPGCPDPECGCALCGLPIGVPDDDPRWENHPDYCDECDVCRDEVPVILFRGEGDSTWQAQFHTNCFRKIVHIREGIQAQSG